MLILTRKTGEGIIIGNDIRVSVLEIRGKQIRLGIEAPADVQVLREEVLLRIQGENLEAAGVQMTDLTEGARIWRKSRE